MRLQKKFNHEILGLRALTGNLCAIDAVGVPYPDETRNLYGCSMLYSAGSAPKCDNDPTATVRH
jgi:hypothetical protein